MTISEIVPPARMEALRKHLSRNRPDIAFSKSRQLADIEADYIRAWVGGDTDKDADNRKANAGHTARTSVAKSAHTNKAQRRVNVRAVVTAVRSFLFNALCLSGVIGHALLVWFDCWSIWSTPGAIGGGIAFIVIATAVVIATDQSRVRTSANALWFVLLVDIAAWFVHFPTFNKYGGAGHEIESGCFAAFICICSWFLLYLFRDEKLD